MCTKNEIDYFLILSIKSIAIRVLVWLNRNTKDKKEKKIAMNEKTAESLVVVHTHTHIFITK